LGSSNGVLVNGERIENVELQTGDRVQLGRMHFDFSIAGESIDEREPVTMIFQPPAPAAGQDQGVPGREKSTKSRVYLWLVGLVSLVGVVAGAAALWLLGR
jgi:pSer/pThr/pTyr-binding forkhead associated (FHA) protein